MKKKLLFLVAAIALFVPGVKAAELTASTDAELINAFSTAASGDTIKLTANIENHKGNSSSLMVTGGKSLTLDLNGHNLSTEPTMLPDSKGKLTIPENKSIIIDNGSLTITGTGTITHKGHVAVSVWASTTSTTEPYSTLTVGKNVTLNGNTGISVFYGTTTQSYGGVVNFQGTINATENGITVNGYIKETSNRPVINVKTGATVNAAGKDAVALYGAGNAVWNIEEGTKITGEGSAIGAKSGTYNIKGGEFTATGAYVARPENYGNGINPSGSTIQIETNPQSYYGNVEMYIENGIFTSKNGNSILEYGSDEETAVGVIKITGGDFSNPEGIAPISISEPLKGLQESEQGVGPISIVTASFTNEIDNKYLAEDTISIKLAAILSDTKESTIYNTIIVPKETTFDEDVIADLNKLIGEEEDGYKLEGYYLDKELKTKADFTKAFNENTTLYMNFVKVEAKGNNTETKNPQTSDINLVLILSAIALASAGAALSIKKRTVKVSK